MSFPEPQFIQNTRADAPVRLAVYSQLPPKGTALKGAILLLHGWPEIAYSWKHQIAALANAGYHVLAPDLRGFGRSDAPRAVDAYAMPHLVSDIEAVLDHYGYGSADICGHDWGGIITWHAARMIAPRIDRVISICTPHVRLAPVDPIMIFKKRYGELHYFVDFNDYPQGSAGAADALFAKDPDLFFRMMFRTVREGAVFKPKHTHIPATFKALLERGAPHLAGQILSDADRAVFVDAYTRSGFSGGINLYRNTTANWELAKDMDLTITQPTLMISPENDLVLPPALTEPMIDMVPDLKRVLISNCGHWAMWEQPKLITGAMLEWLG